MREQNAPTNLSSARVCPCGHWRSGSPHGHVTTCSTSPLPARSSSAMAPCASPSWIASGSVFRIEFSGNTRAILSSLITPHMLEPSAIGPCAQRLCRAQDHGNRGAMYAHSVWHLVSAGNMHIHRHTRIEYMHSRRAKIATQGPQRVAALSAVRQPSRGSPRVLLYDQGHRAGRPAHRPAPACTSTANRHGCGGRARPQAVSVRIPKATVGLPLPVFFSRYSREEYSQTGSAVKVREVRSTQGSFGWQIPY